MLNHSIQVYGSQWYTDTNDGNRVQVLKIPYYNTVTFDLNKSQFFEYVVVFMQPVQIP